jgi:hypothetical protein
VASGATWSSGRRRGWVARPEFGVGGRPASGPCRRHLVRPVSGAVDDGSGNGGFAARGKRTNIWICGVGK